MPACLPACLPACHGVQAPVHVPPQEAIAALQALPMYKSVLP